MQSAKDLAAHLATLPPDIIKLFRLRQALKWRPAPKRPWPALESTAYRLPPPGGLSLYLGRTIHQDSSFDRAVNILRHPAIAALPLRSLALTIDPAAASRRSIDTFATLAHLSGVRQLEWSYDGALARAGAADEILALTVLAASHFDDLEALSLHGPRTTGGELLARPGAFARAVLRPGLAPVYLRIASTAIDDDFAAAITPIAARLRSLSADHPWRDSIPAPILTPQWDRLLAAFPSDNALRFLELFPGGQSVPPETVVHALDRRAFPDLVTLVVRYAALDDRLVDLLPASHLRRGLLLDLDGNRLSAPAVARLQAAATRAGTTLRADHQS
jgi:hypothetical protein